MAYETIRYEVSDNRVTVAHNRADRLWTANSSRRWVRWSSRNPAADDAPRNGGAAGKEVKK
jgi:hypothetical protein